MKQCRKCLAVLDLELFAKKSSSKDGKNSICSDCYRLYMREYYRKNPQKLPRRNISAPTYRKHGLSKEEFEALKNKFQGKCWSCKSREGSCIDHDHSCCQTTFSCGKCVRGYLCNGCNSALGFLDESVEHINSLISYLNAK